MKVYYLGHNFFWKHLYYNHQHSLAWPLQLLIEDICSCCQQAAQVILVQLSSTAPEGVFS